MTTDTSREAFEAWAVSILGDNPNWRESGDCELAWQSWQASRAALEAQQVAVPYDQQALELCNACGWKAIMPGEPCFVCNMQTEAQQVAVPVSYALVPVEPTDEAIELLYGPYLTYAADESRKRSYKEMLAAAQGAVPEPTATGWDNGLSQDYSRELGKWFADRLGARQQLLDDIAKREPLSDAEVLDLMPTNTSMTRQDALAWMARAVERAHNIKAKP